MECLPGTQVSDRARACLHSTELLLHRPASDQAVVFPVSTELPRSQGTITTGCHRSTELLQYQIVTTLFPLNSALLLPALVCPPSMELLQHPATSDPDPVSPLGTVLHQDPAISATVLVCPPSTVLLLVDTGMVVEDNKKIHLQSLPTTNSTTPYRTSSLAATSATKRVVKMRMPRVNIASFSLTDVFRSLTTRLTRRVSSPEYAMRRQAKEATLEDLPMVGLVGLTKRQNIFIKQNEFI